MLERGSEILAPPRLQTINSRIAAQHDDSPSDLLHLSLSLSSAPSDMQPTRALHLIPRIPHLPFRGRTLRIVNGDFGFLLRSGVEISPSARTAKLVVNRPVRHKLGLPTIHPTFAIHHVS